MSGSQVLIAGAAVVVVAVVFAIAATIVKMPPGDGASRATDSGAPSPPLSIDPEFDAPADPKLWARLTAGDDGSPLSAADRLDMISRLEMVGEKWCSDALHAAVVEDPDPQVQDAARAALARMAGGRT